MSRIPNDSLIQVADLDFNSAGGIRDRTEVSRVAVTTDPYRRPFGKRPVFLRFKPFVKLDRVSTHVCMRRSGHFTISRRAEDSLAVFGSGETFLFCHCKTSSKPVLKVREQLPHWPALAAAVVPAAAADQRGRVVAYGQPSLRLLRCLHIDRGAGAARLR